MLKRFRIVGLCLVAVLAMSAVAATSALAEAGPHWRVAGAPLGATTETRAIKFTNNGNTTLKSGENEIICKKAKEKAGAANQIIGGKVGTDKATILFEECKLEKPTNCEVRNVGGPTWGTIEVPSNTELVYTGTEAQAKNHEGPVSVVFKTTVAGVKTFVKLQFQGGLLCGFVGEKTVEATGQERGPWIAGIAGVVCELVGAFETEALSHEINCPETAIKKFYFWNQATPKVIEEGNAELRLSGTVSQQIGRAHV